MFGSYNGDAAGMDEFFDEVVWEEAERLEREAAVAERESRMSLHEARALDKLLADMENVPYDEVYDPRGDPD